MKIEEEEAKERQNEYQGYDRFHLRVVVWWTGGTLHGIDVCESEP